MIKKLVDFALDQRWLTLILAGLFVVFGFYAYFHLPVEAFPDLDDVHVQVIAQNAGQAAAEMESQVSRPIEMQLNGIPGLTQMRSESIFGLSVITCTFEDGTNDYFARSQVMERMQAASLPTTTQWQLGALTTSTGEVYRFTLRTKPDAPARRIEDLRALVDWDIVPRLHQVDGVGDVNVFGGAIKQYQVVCDPQKLKKNGLTLLQLTTALQNNNANTGGDVVQAGEQMLVVRGVGLVHGKDDIGAICIGAAGTRPVLVRDVAQVVEAQAPRQGKVVYFHRGANGQLDEKGKPDNEVGIDDAIEVIVVARKGADAKAVVEALRPQLKTITDSVIPKDVELVEIYDRTVLTHATVHTVIHNLLFGAFLVTVICFIFTTSLRAAALIAMVIPLGMLGMFIVLWILNVPANLLSLGAVDFGILVDAAVVIVEALLIRRMMAKPGQDFLHTTRETSTHLAHPMLFAKIIFVVALIPIFTFQRVEGRIFKPMALTITSATLFALLATLTLVPLASWMFLRNVKPREPHNNGLVRAMQSGYRWLLGWFLRFKIPVTALALLLLGLAVWDGTRLGTEFMPKLDEGNIWLSINTPPSIAKEKAADYQNKVVAVLKKFPEITDIFAQDGRPDDGTDPKGFNNMEIGAYLKPYDQWTTKGDDGKVVNKEGLIAKIKAELDVIPGADLNFSQYIEDNVEEALSGVKGELAIKLSGGDLTVLNDKGREILAAVSSVEGAADPELESTNDTPNLNIKFNREAMARYGVDGSTVLLTVQSALGGQAVGSVLEGQRKFDLAVRVNEANRQDAEAIGNLPVDTATGQRVMLRQVADIRTEMGPSQIARENNSRRVAIKCNVRNRDMGSFVAAAKLKVDAIQLPTGYSIVWNGQFENQERSTKRLAVIVPLSAVGIFGLLVFAFKRFRYAMMIFVTIPFSLLGGIAMLHVTHTHLSVSAMIGFIALSGVGVQNGIVLMTQFNLLRTRGHDLRSAIIEGAVGRLRPVVMTALMASIGMSPMAFSNGMGSEVQRPMALVIMGGMLSTAAITLIILPVIYEVWEKCFPMEVYVPAELVEE